MFLWSLLWPFKLDHIVLDFQVVTYKKCSEGCNPCNWSQYLRNKLQCSAKAFYWTVQLYDTLLQLGKWDHVPITSTLLSTLYWGGTAFKFDGRSSRYKWSGISSLWLCPSDITGVQQLLQFSRMLVLKNLIAHTTPLGTDDVLLRSFMGWDAKLCSFLTAELKTQPADLPSLICERWWVVSPWPWARKRSYWSPQSQGRTHLQLFALPNRGPAE